MGEEDEIKKFMARAMHKIPVGEQETQKRELKKLVVNLLSSQKKVDWSTIAVPSLSGSGNSSLKPETKLSASPSSKAGPSIPSQVPSKRPKSESSKPGPVPVPSLVPKQVQKPTSKPPSAPKPKSKPPAPAPAPKVSASIPFAPPPLSDRPPTAEELSQFQQFMQMAQAMSAPSHFPLQNSVKPANQQAIKPMQLSKEDLEMAEKRKLRFQSEEPSKRPKPSSSALPSQVIQNTTQEAAKPVVGTCENLEKQYLRLTSEPKPENVRPKRVLKKSMTYVLKKFEQEKKYSYIVSQMKSIRQDLNVQGIRDGFTVTVYETNARIALQNRDLGEFNQCLSRLSELYQDANLSYTLNLTSGEFLSYHIYYILYTQAFRDLDIMLNKIQSNPVLSQSEQIKTTLQVVDASMTQDSPAMFGLYNKADLLTQIAMENLIMRERVRSLAALSKARKKSVIPLVEVTSFLGFGTGEEAEDFVRSLTKHIVNDAIECKDAYADFDRAWSQATRSKIDIKGQI